MLNTHDVNTEPNEEEKMEIEIEMPILNEYTRMMFCVFFFTCSLLIIC